MPAGSPSAPIRLATRGSPQARAQAQAVADAIAAATGRSTELVVTQTTGDRQQSVPLHVIGGQGVFVKEVQQAVLDGRADAAVHSAKDLPSDTPSGLVIGAFCARRDPADALIGRALEDLDEGATVASGSVRRRAQLAEARPDLHFVELRGNIARRLEQVPDGGSIVIAVAALEVLGLTDEIADRLDPVRFVPAVGQGSVAVESRIGDREVAEALAAVDDAATRHAVTTERAYQRELGSGCALPVGAYCDGRRLIAFLAGEQEPPVIFRQAVDVPSDGPGAADAAIDLARRAKLAVGA